MINACDARKLSKEGAEKVVIDRYEKLIKDAAEKGEYKIRVKGFISKTIWETLESLGYKIDECDEGYWTEIAW